jgi:hypothetical protein
MAVKWSRQDVIDSFQEAVKPEKEKEKPRIQNTKTNFQIPESNIDNIKE